MSQDPRNFDERWRENSRKMFDSSEARKAFQNVFDHRTSRSLLKLAEREVLEKVHGVVESGKESMIFLADNPEGERVAVKIYMTRAGNFREMKNYLRGDKRFRNVKDDRRSVMQEWTKKEFRNLKKASEVVRCPDAIAVQKNILVMDFLGEDFSPYPRLKDVEVENPQEAWDQTMESIERLWNHEKLVHGDLSEYNMLVDREGRKYWIDFSQGVHVEHPEAEKMLRRDIENVSNFFNRQGAETDEEKAFDTIISGEESL